MGCAYDDDVVDHYTCCGVYLDVRMNVLGLDMVPRCRESSLLFQTGTAYVSGDSIVTTRPVTCPSSLCQRLCVRIHATRHCVCVVSN